MLAILIFYIETKCVLINLDHLLLVSYYLGTIIYASKIMKEPTKMPKYVKNKPSQILQDIAQS